MKKVFLSTLLSCSFFISISSQDNPDPNEVDPSKPTNLYTQINTNLEGSFSEFQNMYGLRVNLSYAINPDNLILVEAPLLFNDRTEKFGLADMRFRYFTAVKRNISQRFIAVAPFADITLPTGSFENGLGSSSWTVAFGSVFGFVLSPKLGFFPGISYVHITKPGTDLIPEESKRSANGLGIQFNASYSFSKRAFLFVNPTPTFLNSDSEWETIWTGEFNFNYIFIPNKLKANIFWGPNFTNDIHVIRMGTTFYL